MSPLLCYCNSFFSVLSVMTFFQFFSTLQIEWFKMKIESFCSTAYSSSKGSITRPFVIHTLVTSPDSFFCQILTPHGLKCGHAGLLVVQTYYALFWLWTFHPTWNTCSTSSSLSRWRLSWDMTFSGKSYQRLCSFSYPLLSALFFFPSLLEQPVGPETFFCTPIHAFTH